MSELKSRMIPDDSMSGCASSEPYAPLVENGYIFRQLSIEGGRYYLQPLNEAYLHEKREIKLEAVEGVIIQQAAPNGRRKDRKKYTYGVTGERPDA